MPRSVETWHGKTTDTKIPPRVVERVAEKQGHRCACCFQRLEIKGTEADHIVALINGGENCERNVQALCRPCHRIKTRLDVQAKALTARIRKKHYGIKGPSRFPKRDGRYKFNWRTKRYEKREAESSNGN